MLAAKSGFSEVREWEAGVFDEIAENVGELRIWEGAGVFDENYENVENVGAAGIMDEIPIMMTLQSSYADNRMNVGGRMNP